jgi:flagellar hook-basal body complex protein FliE
MNIEAIEALGMHDEVGPLRAPGNVAAGAPAAAGFAQRVVEGLQELNGQLLSTQADLQGLALGQAENLHEVVIRLEESRISLQLMLQVRNRVLEAYQDVMRMQV